MAKKPFTIYGQNVIIIIYVLDKISEKNKTVRQYLHECFALNFIINKVFCISLCPKLFYKLFDKIKKDVLIMPLD